MTSALPRHFGFLAGANGAAQAAYVPCAMRTLGLDASAVGLTLATYGAGMVVGALAASRILAAMPFGRVVVAGPATSVLAIATMVATLAWPSGALAGLSSIFLTVNMGGTATGRGAGWPGRRTVGAAACL